MSRLMLASRVFAFLAMLVAPFVLILLTGDSQRPTDLIVAGGVLVSFATLAALCHSVARHEAR